MGLRLCMACLCFSSFPRILYHILISYVMSTFGNGLWLTGLKRHISPSACFYNRSHSSLRLRPPYASTFFFFFLFLSGDLSTLDFSINFKYIKTVPKNSSQHSAGSSWHPLMRIYWGLRSLSSMLGVSPNNSNSWCLLSVYYTPGSVLSVLCVLR